jgi:hypothetical protein
MILGRCATVLWCAGICLTLPACFSLPNYPKDWPALQMLKPGECPAIDGMFDDKPVAVSHGFETDGYSNSLSYYLAPKDDLKYLQAVDRFHVRLQHGTINVVAYYQDQEVLRRDLSTQSPCEQSLARIITDKSFAIDPFSASVLDSKEWRGLGLAADGSLILETHFSGGGTILLIPVVIVRQGWVRYQPSLPTPVGSEQARPAQPASEHAGE